jgi:RNA polymerase sigma-70 factor (ECF subfamily)
MPRFDSMSPFDIDEIARQYFGRIHRAALVLCGNPWDADDLAQETFLVLSRQGTNFQGRSSLYTWLYGILLNLDRRERRRFGMRRKKLRVLWDNQLPDDGRAPGADAVAEVSEWKQSLWARVARLPDGQRQALVLRFSEGLRYEEIAQVLECPLGTVKSRIFHGLAGLRRILDAEGEEARHLPVFPGALPDQDDLSHAV